MKRGVVVLMVAAVVASSGGAATVRPTLSLADRDPVTISLRGFRPHERVKVTLLDDAPSAKTVYTTLGGRGFARFRSVSVDQCEDVRAVATGNKGSRARMIVPNFGCPPIGVP